VVGCGDEVILLIKGVLDQHTFKTSSSNTLLLCN
jgi:hypothetical protein